MWPESFPSQPCPPASEQEVALFVQTIFAPLNPQEQREADDYAQSIERSNFTRSHWQFPSYPIPEAYLNFLQFSNGGYFDGEHRHLNLFKISEVREMMLGYCVPYWMSGVYNFGTDGCGNLYLLDMRRAPINGDYPILLVHAGDMDFADAQRIANSFTELISTALGE